MCVYQVREPKRLVQGKKEKSTFHIFFLLVMTQVEMAKSRTCEKCYRPFKSSLQSHEKNYHALSITAKYTDSQGV